MLTDPSQKPFFKDLRIVQYCQILMKINLCVSYVFFQDFVFLKVYFCFHRCTIKGEEDYRPLFENFVQDLLSTVNKPEWPASELLLSLLGRILVSGG